MRTMNRVGMILLVGLLVAAGVWVVAGSAWGGDTAVRVIAGNQAQMDAARQAGAVARTGEFIADKFVTTTGNLIKVAGISGLIIGLSILLERRKKRPPAFPSTR